MIPARKVYVGTVAEAVPPDHVWRIVPTPDGPEDALVESACVVVSADGSTEYRWGHRRYVPDVPDATRGDPDADPALSARWTASVGLAFSDTTEPVPLARVKCIDNGALFGAFEVLNEIGEENVVRVDDREAIRADMNGTPIEVAYRESDHEWGMGIDVTVDGTAHGFSGGSATTVPAFQGLLDETFGGPRPSH